MSPLVAPDFFIAIGVGVSSQSQELLNSPAMTQQVTMWWSFKSGFFHLFPHRTFVSVGVGKHAAGHNVVKSQW